MVPSDVFPVPSLPPGLAALPGGRRLTARSSPQLLDQAHVRRPVNVQMLFSNPLDEPVKDCVLMVEGSGLLLGSLKIE